jgi:predicted HTH domain antitoxin
MQPMSRITIDIPDAINVAGDNPQAITAEVTMAAAVRLYMTGRLSMLQAAAMVGLSKIIFRQKMGEYGGTEFTQSHDELKQEIIGG